jgi:hypothetical protein
MRPGDHIAVDRGLYTHHGIAIDDRWVVHYTGSPFAWKEARIELATMTTFADGDRVFRVDSPRRFSRDRVVTRARSRVGERDYNLVTNNCEHFAWWARSGAPVSPQVRQRAREARRAGDWLVRHGRAEGHLLWFAGLGAELLQKRPQGRIATR